MANKYPINYPFYASITPDTSAYADGDVVGGLLTFANDADNAPKSGLITHVSVADDDNEGAAYKLWLFISQPSAIADNAAFAPTFADLQKLMARIPIATGDYDTVNSLKSAYVSMNSAVGTPIAYATSTIYGYLVTNGSTSTFAASKTVYVQLHQAGTS